jgi:hypothetical protein
VKRRYIVGIALGGVAVVVCIAVRAHAGATFKVVELHVGKNGDAFSGRVELPDGVYIGPDGGATLCVLDHAGNRYAVVASAGGPGQASFRVPSGYPAVSGRASLELAVLGKLMGTVDLGPFPNAHEVFEVHAQPDARVARDGRMIVVRVRASKGSVKQVLLHPLRTDRQVFASGEWVEMGDRGNGWLGAELVAPYASYATRFEFEVRTERYSPDEFTFPGGEIVEENGRPALAVGKQVDVTTLHGRLVRIPAQRRKGPEDRVVWLVGVVVRGSAGKLAAPDEVVCPRPADLRLKYISVDVEIPKPPRGGSAGGLVPGAGGAGLGRVVPRTEPTGPVRLGPTGPMRIRLNWGDDPRVEIRRFALPVTAATREPRLLLAP